MIEGWDEGGRLVRIATAWVAFVIRSPEGQVVVRLMGGRTLVATGSLEDVLTELRSECVTMH